MSGLETEGQEPPVHFSSALHPFVSFAPRRKPGKDTKHTSSTPLSQEKTVTQRVWCLPKDTEQKGVAEIRL